jgi:hypothetical protein
MGKKRIHYFVPLSILPPLLITATQSARSEQAILKAKNQSVHGRRCCRNALELTIHRVERFDVGGDQQISHGLAGGLYISDVCKSSLENLWLMLAITMITN